MEGVEAVEIQVSENITCQLRIAGECFPVAQGGLKGSGGKGGHSIFGALDPG